MPPRIALDPFRALISVINGVDMLRRVVSAAGLAFDMTLEEGRIWSQETTIRAFTPRIFAAYDALNDQDKMIAAQAAHGAMRVRDQGVADRATEALARIGWQVQGATIVVARPDLREVFFLRTAMGPSANCWRRGT